VPALDLFAEASVAIDGSKFKAVNNRDRNFTRAKMERRLAQIEESVARYLQQLDSADRQEPSEARQSKTTRLKEKIAKLKEEVQRLHGLKARMLAAPDQQISLTDPDSRSMATSGRGSGVVGYNVQVAVDIKHHLIITHEVTNVGSDRAQLAHMANSTKATLESTNLDVVADRGYFSGEEILECDKAGITVTLPKPMTSNATLRQAGLPIRNWRERLYLPCRRASRILVHNSRTRDDPTPVLDQPVSKLRDQTSLHHWKGATHHTMGARTRP
jgi:hypothetical protein